MTITRRTFLQHNALALSAFGLSQFSQGQSNAANLNIVLIFLDDSGWGDFRPFGSPTYPTPNVDRLAQEGCAYRNFYVPQAIFQSGSNNRLLSGSNRGFRSPRCYG